jgi:hypothetical protein
MLMSVLFQRRRFGGRDECFAAELALLVECMRAWDSSLELPGCTLLLRADRLFFLAGIELDRADGPPVGAR